MAEGKKSFLLYTDIIHTVKRLPKDKQAELFILILEYVNDLNPVVDDLILDIAFEPIKQSLKRNLVNWKNQCDVNSKNGKLGGRPKKTDNNQDEPKETEKTESVILKAKKADIDNDIDSDIDTDNVLLDAIAPKTKTPDEISFDKFNKWLLVHAPNVLKMKEPITCEQLVNLKRDFKIEFMLDMFQKMHNHRDLFKKLSANLTFRNWSKREPTAEPVTEQPQRKIIGFKTINQ